MGAGAVLGCAELLSCIDLEAVHHRQIRNRLGAARI